MSKYGLKIMNVEAASAYEYSYGFRNSLDSTRAMLVNSLFLDFLLDNDLLDIYRGEYTRSIVGVSFSYGTKDYGTTKTKLESLVESGNEKFKENLTNLEKNKDKCVKISRQDLRTLFYTEGFEIEYRNYNKKGEVIKTEKIHYTMLYRTPGKAKRGNCMFIDSRIYEQVHNFLYMGIKLPEKNAPIVEIGAYSSLITSSIIDRVRILPEQMLIVEDVESFFKTNVLAVEKNKRGHCKIEAYSDYELKNEMFDGEALIDSSIFPKNADGYVLLRHHFTKMAAFNTNIQLFMKDYFDENYETATVKDLWGRDVRVKDVRLITTNNAIKWKKFGISFDYWAEWLKKNDFQFGIVKTSHESKLGDVQRMSYQMVNTLEMDIMPEVIKPAMDYISRLKTDDEEFLRYLDRNKTFSNDFEVLIALVRHNPDFVRSSYFRDRRKEILRGYVMDFKSGHIIQNADNMTLCGSPYALLLHSVGGNVEDDPTLKPEEGCIQCYTERFEDGEYLAGFRSPHNSKNNTGYFHNVKHPYMSKYFKFGQLCLAVNTRGTDVEPRLNGADFDSDACYLTNQPQIVGAVKDFYKEFPTIDNRIPQEKNIYSSSLEDFARVDNMLGAAQRAIGESSNLAQIALSYTYNMPNKKYADYVCILAILAQVSIDNCKRAFDIDLPKEINRIKKDLQIDKNGYPKFWSVTKRDRRKVRSEKERFIRDSENRKKVMSKVNPLLSCPMNYLFDAEIPQYRSPENTIPISEFWVKHEQTEHHRKSEKVEKLIEKYSLRLHDFNTADEYDEDEDLLLREEYEQLIEDIRRTYISRNYVGLMSWLINRAFVMGTGVKGKHLDVRTKKNKSLLLKVLYDLNPDCLLQCFVVGSGEQH